MNGAARTGWLVPRVWIPILVLSCIAIALYAVSFAAGRAFPPEVGINQAGRTVLLTHAIAAGIALALGPWQFVYGIRERWPRIHRTIGKGYVIACLIGGASGMALALGTSSGPVARWGFFALAAAWLASTVVAYLLARRRNFSGHRKWMIRSFALSFAAVTLRIYLGVALSSGLVFADAYPIIAWLCWVPNLIVAELYLRLSRDPYRPLAAAQTGAA